MDEYKKVEKRTEVREEIEPEPKTKVTNINVGPDGGTQVQEETEVDDEEVAKKIIRTEETIEKHQR